MDLITCIPSLTAFKAEAVGLIGKNELFKLGEDDNLYFDVTKIPVTHSSDGDKTLCLCRVVSRDSIDELKSIKVLGECVNGEYIFSSEDSRGIYESIHDTSTRMIDDGEGGQIEYTPPYKIGVFA